MVQAQQWTGYKSATIPNPDGCEKVTDLMKRTNLAWAKHGIALAGAGAVVFGGLLYLDRRKKSENV